MKNRCGKVIVAALAALFFGYSAFVAVQVSEASEGASQEQVRQDVKLLRRVNKTLEAWLFFDLGFGKIRVPEVDHKGNPQLDEQGVQKEKQVSIPLIVGVLLAGAIFFTFFYGFINIRAFRHAWQAILGRFDNPKDQGEISHFRALTSALSATVGLGNIAGVAVAIQWGGPGAVLWMMIMAFFGMSSKFSSCTLSQMFRKTNSDGSISGGPMYYLDIGFKQMGGLWKPLGKGLALLYGLMIMGGALGAGNMFQVNQTVEVIQDTFGLSKGGDWIWTVGFIAAALVAIVILGGIKRIGYATSRLVPAMVCIYVGACLFVIGANIKQLPEALYLIVHLAFNKNAFFGGFVGVMVAGLRRAAFSNEAGLGTAAVAHAAAKTNEPVREGIVGMIEPVIDTIIICLMTALVVVITGTWARPDLAAQGTNIGVTITAEAFRTVLPWFPYVLTVSICLFAYSTLICWCYYGERGWIYLLDHFGGIGLKTVFLYRIVFIVFVVVGAVNALEDVILFTDTMTLGLALPNIIGSIFLAPKVKTLAEDYIRRLKSGEMKPIN